MRAIIISIVLLVVVISAIGVRIGNYTRRVNQNSDLAYAAGEGDIGRVRSLLSAGADPNCQDGKRPSWSTALSMAAMNSHIEIVRLLLDKGADPNRAIVSAAAVGETSVLRLLIERGANIRSEEGNLALLNAAEDGHLNCVKVLVNNGADVSARDYDGKTPLLLAQTKGHPVVADYLINAGVSEQGH